MLWPFYVPCVVNKWESIDNFPLPFLFPFSFTTRNGKAPLHPPHTLLHLPNPIQSQSPPSFCTLKTRWRIYTTWQIHSIDEACHWVLLFLVEDQGVGMLSSSSSWEKCCSSGVTLAHGWLSPKDIQLKTFKVQQDSYPKGWPCALAPSAARLLRTLTCWIGTLRYSAILEVGHVFLTSSLIHRCVVDLRIMCLHPSTDRCDVAVHIAHTFRACHFSLHVHHFVATTTCPRLNCTRRCSQLMGYLYTGGRTFVQFILILSL